jgi:phosphoglycolate phosphatase
VRPLLFDFDGTLFDSSEGIYKSFCVSSNSIGFSQPPKSDVISHIGPPIGTIAQKIYKNISAEQLDRFITCFRSHYDNHGYLHSYPYCGIAEMLNRTLLGGKRFHPVVITNKPTQPTRNLLDINNMMQEFANIIGIDYLQTIDVGNTFSSKAEAIRYVINGLPKEYSQPIYIGDTLSDAEAANQAGCSFIGVSYGFFNWSCLAPHIYPLAQSPKDLERLINDASI